MGKKRRSFGHELKLEAVALAAEGGLSMPQAGKGLGISHCDNPPANLYFYNNHSGLLVYP